MARTLCLNDGSMEVVLGDTGVFLEHLIREKLGDDAARLFLEWVEENKDEWGSAQESIEEHERIADGYHTMCCDARDAFQELLDLLDEPRLDREALRTAAQTGFDDLNSNL